MISLIDESRTYLIACKRDQVVSRSEERRVGKEC